MRLWGIFVVGLIAFGLSAQASFSNEQGSHSQDQSASNPEGEWLDEARDKVEEIRKFAPSHAARLDFLVLTYEREGSASLIRKHIEKLFSVSTRVLQDSEDFRRWRDDFNLKVLPSSSLQDSERERASRSRAFYISSFEMISDNQAFLEKLQPGELANILSELSRFEDFTWVPSRRIPSLGTIREIEMTNTRAIDIMSEFVHAWFSARYTELSASDVLSAIDFQTGSRSVLSAGKFELFNQFLDFIARGRIDSPERLSLRFVQGSQDFSDAERSEIYSFLLKARWQHLRLRQPELAKAFKRAFGEVELYDEKEGGTFVLSTLFVIGQPWANKPIELLMDLNNLIDLSERAESLQLGDSVLELEKFNSLILLRVGSLLENAKRLSFTAGEREKILKDVLNLATKMEKRERELENRSRDLVALRARDSDWRAFGQSLVELIEKWAQAGLSDAESLVIERLIENFRSVEYRGRFFTRVKLADRIDDARRTRAKTCEQPLAEMGARAKANSSEHLPPY